MTVFQVWRQMLKKPLPRVLFGYIYGSLAVFFLIWFFTPIQVVWKQLIAFLLVFPYAVGIPLLELCLLVRERRLNWYFTMCKKILPMFLFVSFVNWLLSPNFSLQIFLGGVLTMFIATLYGSWSGRMIKLGHFGEPPESEVKKH